MKVLMICLKSWEYEIQNHSYQSGKFSIEVQKFEGFQAL